MTNHMTPHPADARDYQFLIDWLVGYRKTLRLSQREVARRMGASNSTVHYMEAQAKDVPVKTLQAYCRALGGELDIKFVLPGGKPS
ncbi:MAG TPA: helix-turn-helix transcriptional regulator [Kribbellaceae bacterium]|nr:helix-turn-helix transcriptional regulator [Kribbellaceae bacterium]